MKLLIRTESYFYRLSLGRDTLRGKITRGNILPSMHTLKIYVLLFYVLIAEVSVHSR